MKFYTEEEILDKHIGKKGTPKRDQFEADLNSSLIGEAIKQARQSKNLTQEELGNLIGVQRAQISRIENGKNLTFSRREIRSIHPAALGFCFAFTSIQKLVFRLFSFFLIS